MGDRVFGYLAKAVVSFLSRDGGDYWPRLGRGFFCQDANRIYALSSLFQFVHQEEELLRRW